MWHAFSFSNFDKTWYCEYFSAFDGSIHYWQAAISDYITRTVVILTVAKQLFKHHFTREFVQRYSSILWCRVIQYTNSDPTCSEYRFINVAGGSCQRLLGCALDLTSSFAIWTVKAKKSRQKNKKSIHILHAGGTNKAPHCSANQNQGFGSLTSLTIPFDL